MRIRVDRDLCEANALCQKAAPEVFEVDDRDELELKIERPDETLRAKVERAVHGCPRQALSLVEDGD